MLFLIGYANAVSAQIQYDFRAWPTDGWKAPGHMDSIKGKICPTPVPDANTIPTLKVYFGLPSWEAMQENRTQIVSDSNKIPTCDNPVDIGVITPNFTGTYPVYAVSQWMQNGIIQTVQSNDTHFLAIQPCDIVYVADFNKTQYHPGDIIPIKVSSPERDCMHLSGTAWITIYNATNNNSEENMLYQKSQQVVNESWFNYTVPKWTDKNGIFNFLVRLTWPNPDGPGKFDTILRSSDDSKQRTYNLTMWIDPSSVTNGSSTAAITKICPVSPATDNREQKRDLSTQLITDPGSDILFNYYLTLPDGSKKLVQDTRGPNGDCNNDWSEGAINANIPGTWLVNVTAEWFYNGTLHTLQGKQVQLDVRKPIFQSHKIDQFNITKITELSHVTPGNKPRFDVMDWSQDGKNILLNYRDYADPPNSYWLHLATMNLENKDIIPVGLPSNITQGRTLFDAKFSSTNDSLYVILNEYLYKYDLQNKTYGQLSVGGPVYGIQVLHNGDLVYSQGQSNQNDSVTKFDLWMAHPDGIKIRKITEVENLAFFDLSPDGKRLALSVSKSYGNGIPGGTVGEVLDLDTGKISEFREVIAGDVQGKWTPAGSLIVWHVSAGDKVPGGDLTISDPTNSFQETLFVGYDDPRSFVISPSGDSIIYGLDYQSCCAESSGLYQMYLAKPVPEFPFVQIILVASIISSIIFYRIRIRK